MKRIERTVVSCKRCHFVESRSDKEIRDYDLKQGVSIGGSEGMCYHCTKYLTCEYSARNKRFVYVTCPITEFEMRPYELSKLVDTGDILYG